MTTSERRTAGAGCTPSSRSSRRRACSTHELRGRTARSHLGAKPRRASPHSRLRQGEDWHGRPQSRDVHEPRDPRVRGGRAARATTYLVALVGDTKERLHRRVRALAGGRRMSHDHDHDHAPVEESPVAIRVHALADRLVDEGVVTREELPGADRLARLTVARRRRTARCSRVARRRLQAAFARGCAQGRAGGWSGPRTVPDRRRPGEHGRRASHGRLHAVLATRKLLGPPPDWYKSLPYRSRAVSDPRGVLREFGVELADDVEYASSTRPPTSATSSSPAARPAPTRWARKSSPPCHARLDDRRSAAPRARARREMNRRARGRPFWHRATELVRGPQARRLCDARAAEADTREEQHGAEHRFSAIPNSLQAKLSSTATTLAVAVQPR